MSSTHEIELFINISYIISFWKVNLREFNGWDAKKNQTRQHVKRKKKQHSSAAASWNLMQQQKYQHTMIQF